MRNYEEKIYSLGETVTGQTQAMSQAVQKTLENNGGVGIMTGYYDQNLSVLSVSNLLLHSTGYTFDSFMKQTKGSLKNFFYDEEDILAVSYTHLIASCFHTFPHLRLSEATQNPCPLCRLSSYRGTR